MGRPGPGTLFGRATLATVTLCLNLAHAATRGQRSTEVRRNLGSSTPDGGRLERTYAGDLIERALTATVS